MEQIYILKPYEINNKTCCRPTDYENVVSHQIFVTAKLRYYFGSYLL